MHADHFLKHFFAVIANVHAELLAPGPLSHIIRCGQLNWVEVNGQELTMASTSTSAVLRSSHVNFTCPIILCTHLLTDFISCSNMLPHQGASSKLNFHLMPSFARYLVSSGCFIISLRVFATALNTSHCLTLIFWATPSGPAKHSRHLQREFKMYCMSIQVNKHIHTLLLVTPWLRTINGPALSTSV